MAAPKTVVAADKANLDAAAVSPAALAAVPPVRVVRFWRCAVGYLSEIKFQDGEIFRPPSQSFVVSDARLLAKLEAEKEKFHLDVVEDSAASQPK